MQEFREDVFHIRSFVCLVAVRKSTWSLCVVYVRDPHVHISAPSSQLIVPLRPSALLLFIGSPPSADGDDDEPGGVVTLLQRGGPFSAGVLPVTTIRTPPAHPHPHPPGVNVHSIM